MKIKTSTLIGTALDWAVAKAMGLDPEIRHTGLYARGWPRAGCSECPQRITPSTDWAQGGPIIEREWLDVTPWPNESDENLRWQCSQHDSIDCTYFGPTPLIAAMRCYVASKLGDEVDVPEELCI